MTEIPAANENVMETMRELLSSYSNHAFKVLTAPFDPNQRVFILYLTTSALAAFFVYRAMRKRGGGETSFLRFLFPRHVWRHPSAWLDLRYFFFHMLVGHFLMAGLTLWATAGAFQLVAGRSLVDTVLRDGASFSAADFALTAVYMFGLLAVLDFVAYAIHYLQHRVPILWEFHKVHHSAEVMHPISNYREHPVDNIVYKYANGLAIGGMAGMAVNAFGYVPSMPSLLGVPLLMLGFNLLAYNLRHSHVWLRWPGRWSMILPSPAHHHVHHSCHPDHIDKNFAFLFPVWDVIFKTYCMPADNRDVKFGIGEGKAAELTSCVRLYFIPFRDAWRIVREDFRRMRRPRNTAAPAPADAS